MLSRKRRTGLAIGLVLAVAVTFAPVVAVEHASEQRVAVTALGIAIVALLAAVFLSVSLEAKVDTIAADVHRIANAIAPNKTPMVEIDMEVIDATDR